MKKKYLIAMILSFLYGGFSVIMSFLFAYSTFWASGFFGLRQGRFSSLNPIALITSPFSLMFLFGGLVSTMAGVTIWHLTREKELKAVKEDITSLLLTPEEKKIIDVLNKNKGELTQSKLVRKTGFSKVKVHRALVKLESRKIISKYPYGLTNKIILEKLVI